MDQFNRVLTDCVFFGRERVPGKTVVEKYEGVRLSPAYMKLHLTLMTDLFCQPEATLIADLIQICRNKGLKFSPTNLVDDVRGLCPCIGFLSSVLQVFGVLTLGVGPFPLSLCACVCACVQMLSVICIFPDGCIP